MIDKSQVKENILIAGSSGAIGREFIKLYSDEPNVEKIITLSRKTNDSSNQKIKALEIDYSN
jgi:FlaA1/EpsC-like NDP-sugar epimerase